jgi:hypothetical protein
MVMTAAGAAPSFVAAALRDVIASHCATAGRQVWNRQRTDRDLADPADVSLGHKAVQRWNLPSGWVTSSRQAHPALVSEADFIAAQDISAARGLVPAETSRRRSSGGTCWPGCWPGARAGGGWNQPGPTASPRTGAATARGPGIRAVAAAAAMLTGSPADSSWSTAVARRCSSGPRLGLAAASAASVASTEKVVCAVMSGCSLASNDGRVLPGRSSALKDAELLVLRYEVAVLRRT